MKTRKQALPEALLDAATLVAARREAGLTQSALARDLDVPRSLVGHWETGTRAIAPERARELQRVLSQHRRRRTRGHGSDLSAAALRVVRKQPGLSRNQVVEQLGRRRGANAAVASLLERGELHERLHDVVNARGENREQLGLFPGPAAVLFESDAPALAGDALRREREVLGLTQTELAHRVGVSPQLVGLWESDRRRPTGARRATLAAALHPTGTQLRALRESYGWSQRAIALQLGVQPSSWCQWESGRRALDRDRWLELRRALEQVGAAPSGAALERAVANLVDAAHRHAGRTRAFVLASLNSPLGESALHVALARELVHERNAPVEQRGPHGETQLRMRGALYPGPAPALAATAASMTGEQLRRRRRAVHWTQRKLADELGISDQLVRRWERRGVPPARLEQVRTALERPPISDAARVEVFRRAIVKLVEEEPGLSRFEIARRMRLSHRNLAGVASTSLAQALERREVHERVVQLGRSRTRIGLFPGPAPAAWRARELTGRELRAAREERRLTARELAQLLGVSTELVFTWERGRQAIPTARRAQLHQVLADSNLAPIAAETIAEARQRHGHTQAALAELLEVSQATISGWERGGHVPLSARAQLRTVLGI